MLTCNVCGGHNLQDSNGRHAARCADCGAMERTRILKTILDATGWIKPGMRVMHLAPEQGIGLFIKQIVGTGYEAFDINPAAYAPALETKRMDLAEESERLPSNVYDIVLHSHVMEHVPCNETAVLYHLHRALKPGGKHLFCIPIHDGYYESDLSPLSPAERRRRFHQDDHMRRFGLQDIQKTVGMLFDLQIFDLEALVGKEQLNRNAIPETAWRQISGHTYFVADKNSLKLKA